MQSERYLTEAEVKLLISQELKPIETTLTVMGVTHKRWFGDGNGNAGEMTKISRQVETIASNFHGQQRVKVDRRWLFTTVLIAIPVLIDAAEKLHKIFGN